MELVQEEVRSPSCRDSRWAQGLWELVDCVDFILVPDRS